MASFDYSGLASTATALIERFGTSVDLMPRVDVGTKAKPEVTFPNRLPVLGVLLNYKATQIDGVRITEKDRKVISASDQQEPQVKDRLSFGGVDFEIINVAPLRPDGSTTLIYTLQVRA